jgi:phosphoglycolate phosphatase
MSKFPFDIVGFDLDGTLIDTSEDLRNSCNHALAVGGIAPLDAVQIRSAIGGGARLMLQRGIGEQVIDSQLFERMYAAFLDHYAANIAIHSQPFPGALDMLDALDALGVKLALVTNKTELMADLLFRELGLRERFAVFLGRDSLGICWGHRVRYRRGKGRGNAVDCGQFWIPDATGEIARRRCGDRSF